VEPVSAQVSKDGVAKTREALKALKEKRYADATKLFGEAIDLEKKYEPTAEDYLDEADDHLGSQPPNLKAAEEAISQALKLDPMSADVYYLRSRLFKAKKETQLAVNDLEKTLEIKPDHSEAAYDLWELLETQKRFDLAELKFKALSMKNPKQVAFLYYLGQAYHERGNDELATGVLADLVKLHPEIFEYHDAYVHALGFREAIPVYEKLVTEKPDPVVKRVLAELYLADLKDDKPEAKLQRRDKARLILKEIIQAGGLDSALRLRLAELLSKAEEFELAADQAERALKMQAPNVKPQHRLLALLKCGKFLVKAGRWEQAIERLDEAMQLHRQTRADRPSAILFYLGQAYHLGNNRSAAEEYFREFQRGLDLVDLETVDSLLKIYETDGSYKQAAALLERAVRDYPKEVRLELKYAQVLAEMLSWQSCIIHAEKVVDHKEFGRDAELLLARAHLANKQPDRAIDHLRKLENSPAWNNETDALMGRALVAGNRMDAALKYIEKAYQARPNHEPTMLLYAQVLTIVGRREEARRLFEDILKVNERSVAAWVGLGDLEIQFAKGSAGDERVTHLRQAADQYKEAFGLQPTEEVLAKRGEAERDLSQAEAILREKSDRLWSYFYAGGLVLAAIIPVMLIWIFSRRKWASHCFEQVMALEQELKDLIRNRVMIRWNNHWDELGKEPFLGRLDYKSLKNKAQRENVRDVLDAANFGHMVGIIAAGWEVLGFNELSTHGTKALTIAGLSYVGDCRNAIFHSVELERLLQSDAKRKPGQANQPKRRGFFGRLGQNCKWIFTGFGLLSAGNMGTHLNYQVKSSIKAIRKNFDLRGGASDDAGGAIVEVEAEVVGDAPRDRSHELD
jgi:tetratricopeptide (TPR) repeat protein